MSAPFSRHSGRCSQTALGIACDDYVMTKDIDMGAAGSLTISLLVIAFAFLMRSFYKRFMGVDRNDDASK